MSDIVGSPDVSRKTDYILEMDAVYQLEIIADATSYKKQLLLLTPKFAYDQDMLKLVLEATK